MSYRDDACSHLKKAREFLEAARVNAELGLNNVTTSNSVTAAINAKDVICLLLTGRSGKTENHQEARTELRAAGPLGRDLEPTLGRLLRLKPRAQYLTDPVSSSDASKAVQWAPGWSTRPPSCSPPSAAPARTVLATSIVTSRIASRWSRRRRRRQPACPL
jgi:hypothetical protein